LMVPRAVLIDHMPSFLLEDDTDDTGVWAWMFNPLLISFSSSW
jgi:hypothetical protein